MEKLFSFFCSRLEVFFRKQRLLALGLPVSKEFSFLFSDDFVFRLVEEQGAKFWVEKTKTVFVEIKGLVFLVSSRDNLWVLKEIFLDAVYNFDFSSDFVVLDVGQHVGIASLFFASKKNVLAVFGFEPFKKTNALALKNFALNPLLSKKIRSFCFGLGNKNSVEFWDYCLDGSSNCGVAKLPVGKSGLEKARVELVCASEALDLAKKEFPSKKIFAKIDCEGSEYEIMEDLFKKKRLSELSVIVLETHDPEKNKRLFELLSLSGFSFFCLNSGAIKSVGFIYAFNKKGLL